MDNHSVPEEIKPGDCVIIADGRIARVRELNNGIYKIRVKRTTSQAHEFMEIPMEALTKIECPKGWMSPDGYNKYLRVTLEKMRLRKHKS
jgi:hypothetical protein